MSLFINAAVRDHSVERERGERLGPRKSFRESMVGRTGRMLFALLRKAYSKLTGTFCFFSFGPRARARWGVCSRGSTGKSRAAFGSTANRCISSRSVREMTSRSLLSKSLSTPSSRRSLPLLPPALQAWIDLILTWWISDRLYVAYRTVRDISLT